jgi:predicted  nucleic acid-binding Zn-ribbon protein
MSEWSYYDKSDLISNVKSIKRTTESTEEDVRRLRRQIEEMTRNQQEILQAFQAMAREVAAMREELYPSVKGTKPAFKAPRNGGENG